jgi:hypothetical protein
MAAMLLLAGVAGTVVALWGLASRSIRDIDVLLPDVDASGDSGPADATDEAAPTEVVAPAAPTVPTALAAAATAAEDTDDSRDRRGERDEVRA